MFLHLSIYAFLHDISAQSLYILSMMFQNFVHTISLICAYQLTPAYLCPSTVLYFLNTVSSLFLWHNLFQRSRPSEGNNQAVKDGFWSICTHFYRWHISDCVHFANGSEQIVELHILRHHYVKAGMLNHLDLQKCKPKENWQLHAECTSSLGRHLLLLALSHQLSIFEYYFCCQYIDWLHCAGERKASNTFSMIASKVM